MLCALSCSPSIHAALSDTVAGAEGLRSVRARVRREYLLLRARLHIVVRSEFQRGL